MNQRDNIPTRGSFATIINAGTHNGEHCCVLGASRNRKFPVLVSIDIADSMVCTAEVRVDQLDLLGKTKRKSEVPR